LEFIRRSGAVRQMQESCFGDGKNGAWRERKSADDDEGVRGDCWIGEVCCDGYVGLKATSKSGKNLPGIRIGVIEWV